VLEYPACNRQRHGTTLTQGGVVACAKVARAACIPVGVEWSPRPLPCLAQALCFCGRGAPVLRWAG
jgi:hypothetical protein